MDLDKPSISKLVTAWVMVDEVGENPLTKPVIYYFHQPNRGSRRSGWWIYQSPGLVGLLPNRRT